MANKAGKILDSGFSDWNPSKLPDLQGKTVFITGGNSGIGLEAAKILIGKRANIIFTSRSSSKGLAAQEEIKAQGSGTVDFIGLDLSNLDSIRKCADEIRSKVKKIDILINNAGIMMTPQTYTQAGHELQFATNHLGHFLLNSLLFDLIDKEAGRIVVVSSIVHKTGAIHFDDLMLKKSYSPKKAYDQSKLANLMYAFELHRRLQNAGSRITVVACHPGYSDTNLQTTGPAGFTKVLLRLANKLMAQDPKNGAYPTVLAAAGLEAKPGAYYGPQQMAECKGRISDALVAPQALDEVVARKLWEKSEQLVHAKFLIERKGSTGKISANS